MKHQLILPTFIQSISTAVPPTSYPQEVIGEAMLRQLDPKSRGARLLRRIYRNSGIDKRHSVIRDLRPGEGTGLFFDPDNANFLSPSTKERNEVYTRESRILFSETARKVIDKCEGIDRGDITHVITVSCTGFFAPGPDYYIVKDLGLDPSIERFHIGFMGCYAAFPALKMAKAFCTADPDAVVLIVCLELCTLHLEPSEIIDDIIASSVFADGASGAIVSAREPKACALALRIDSLLSTIAPDSEGDMAWTIGDHGFDMVLSTYVPRILEANIDSVVRKLLEQNGLSFETISHWAIHPGGRAILDKVGHGLGLDEDALAPSRHILREYGNMSSATILFVLEEFLKSGRTAEGETVCAMAFGPGLTVESALLRRV